MLVIATARLWIRPTRKVLARLAAAVGRSSRWTRTNR